MHPNHPAQLDTCMPASTFEPSDKGNNSKLTLGDLPSLISVGMDLAVAYYNKIQMLSTPGSIRDDRLYIITIQVDYVRYKALLNKSYPISRRQYIFKPLI